jgi:hypothetical protein
LPIKAMRQQTASAVNVIITRWWANRLQGGPRRVTHITRDHRHGARHGGHAGQRGRRSARDAYRQVERTQTGGSGSDLATEFGRCYEEQNLGIPMEEALDALANRVPNLDLRFFATAVILQRQTGGDLAEILDKIGHLIRERFKIWGQIQALTGEGRLSGIVLLGLPPALFGVMLKLNYDYVMVLFEDPLGKKMMVFGIIMQFIGALVIKKIVNIKV